MAGPTRLELATSCVTGRRSNRLNYGPAGKILDWWAVSDLNGRPSGCKPDALTAELTAHESLLPELQQITQPFHSCQFACFACCPGIWLVDVAWGDPAGSCRVPRGLSPKCRTRGAC